jgi:hypothetical protein
MKRMAADNPPERQQGTMQNAVFFNRLVRIRGTARVIPANRRKMGRKSVLIKPYKIKGYILHFNKPALVKRNRSCSILTESAAPVSG